MNCPACAHANRPGAKFCEECAAPLPRACTSCGAELRASAKFCDECGTPVAAASAQGGAGAGGQRASEARSEAESVQPSEAQRGSRKIVTIVFADLVGSTALHERLDPESVRRFMESYYAAMRGAVEAHGGRVTQVMGDGVKAVFGTPRVAEDDALRAVRAGVEMQRFFRELAQRESRAVGQTGLRVAVNTGEVVADDATEIIGDPVNVAARLQEKGGDGDVVIGGETQRIVATQVTLALLGSFALKGRSEPVKAYRVESLESPARAATAPFVGRDAELARLTAAYEAALAKPATQLAVLLGSPGLGKSRLIEEFARRIGDATTVMSAHCDAAGGATFAPLARALREGLGIEDAASGETLRVALDAALPGSEADRARIANGIAALLGGSPASPEETFFVVRRLLGALAAQKPVLLVIDDLHWAETLLLDLVEHLVQWGSGTRLLVLVGARPELRDARSSLATPGGLVSEVIALAGLDAGAATRLAANVIGAADLPAAIAAKLLITSEGNPLFVGELVRMLVEEGALRREGERWVASAELAALEMPPTIHALLAARIERLRPEERAVLERAAVVGRHFSRNAVAALLAPRDVTELDARLEALRRSELIESDSGWWLGDPALRFHHVLIRDAAYRRVLKGTRAELHARLADWIEARAGESTEHDETIGWHLEQAHEHLRELGPLDARGVLLGTRAAQRLAAAGRRALARDDLALAGSLLRRALERLDPADTSRAELALDCSEALLASGEVGPAAAVIEKLGRLASDSERLRAWHTCFAGQLTALTNPQGLNAAAASVASAAEVLARLGDAAGEAKAHHVHAQALARLGRVGAAEAALDRALAAARRAGDRRRANAVLAGAPLAALWGPSPVTRASGRCLDVVRVLRITQDAPAVEAVALSCQGVLEALRGRTDAARRMVASARKMVEELGVTQRVLEVDVIAARIDLLEGDAASAERLLRSASEGLRALGLGIDAARAAALLGRALLAQGRGAEAEALSHESEALAGDDLQAAIAWRGVRAEALTQRGEHAAALALAQAAVEIASATDALLDHADARLSLATVLRAAGRTQEASAEEKRATSLWAAKDATLLAERARSEAKSASLDPLSVPTPAAAAGKAALAPRRVHPNAASAAMALFEAAFAARDFEAIEALLAESQTVVDHPNGASYERAGEIAALRKMLRSRETRWRRAPIATLGEVLSLDRRFVSGHGTGGGRFDVADYQLDSIVISEVDERGRFQRLEIFGGDHLGDAIARLYARYAELLPEGAERTRAEATARSVAVLCEPFDFERFAGMFAPGVAVADARSVGTGPLRGAEEVLRSARALFDLCEGFDWRIDDVFGAVPHALCLRHTSFGNERVGGGAFERNLNEVWVFGERGLITRWERFDFEHEAEALARFDELTGAAEPARPPARRVRANTATRNIERFSAALAARDAAALALTFDESLHVMHHPTRATYGRRGMVGTWRSAMRAAQFEFRQENLAVLGDSLALERHFVSVEGLADANFEGFGRSEFHELALFDVAASGRVVHLEIFAAAELSHAICRLYERYAESLPEGAERTRAEAIACSASVMLGQPDLAATAAVLAPAVEFTDLRTVGFGTLRGAATVIDTIGAMLKLSSDDTARIDDVLALETDALVVRWTNQGTDRASGGVFERKLCQLFTFGEDGLVTRWQQFEAEHEADALARFDELKRREAAPPAEPFANAASRAVEREVRAFAGRDWEGVVALFSPAVRFHDRRRMMHVEIGYEACLVQERMLFDQPTSRWHEPLIATRGERLSLHRCRFEAEVAGGGGPLAIDEHLVLVEVDVDGRLIANVLFDLEDEDAAYAELDARFEAGEAAWMPAFVRVVGQRDWGALAELCAPSLIAEDHRLVSWGTLRGLAEYVPALRSMVDLAADARLRLDHLRTSGRGELFGATWHGTRDGGAFEIPMVGVHALDAQGRQLHFDLYDPEQQGQARARFEAILAPAPPTARFENAATRAAGEMLSCWSQRDWQRFARLLSESLRYEDRRPLVRLELGREQYLTFIRQLGDMGSSRFQMEVLATRGDRLALVRSRNEAAEGDVGPSEIESLLILETGERGEIVLFVRFDRDEVDAAYAELDARFEAGEAADHPQAAAWAAEFRRAFAQRDWAALERLAAFSEVAHNHRLVGWGTLHGPTWVGTLKPLVELAPDVRERIDHLCTCERGFLWASLRRGTREGGAFETPWLFAVELDERGRQTRLDVWDSDALPQARARFEEIRARSASTPARARFENTAAAVAKRVAALMEARDWERFAQQLAPGLRSSDRRKLTRIELDRDGYIAFTRSVGDMASMDYTQKLLATRGDRLALHWVRLDLQDGDIGPSEIVSLGLIETNEREQVAQLIRFDLDDQGAAYAELDALFEAGEGVEHRGPAAPGAVPAAVTRRDWDAALAACAPDMVCVDHRLLGWGTLHGAEAWVETQRVLADLAPDFQMRTDHLRTCARGYLHESMTFGTRDGGAFERPMIGVNELNGSRKFQRIDLYDPGQLDAALARFEDLGRGAERDPLVIPSNLASRTVGGLGRHYAAADLAAIRAVASDDFHFEDRQRHSLVRGGVDEWIGGLAFLLGESAARIETQLLATAGDRLALYRVAWRDGSDRGDFEIGCYRLAEVNAAGQLCAFLLFDLDSRAAANAELLERYVASGAEGMPASGIDFVRAFNEHDLGRLRGALPGDFIFHDRRRTGFGRLEGADAYIASVAALHELSHDVRLEELYYAAIAPHGRVAVARMFGTNAEGGEFESYMIRLSLYRDERFVQAEMLELDDLEAALERFEELRPDPLRISPTLATRVAERHQQAFLAREWATERSLLRGDFTYEDRSKRALIRGDAETLIASMKHISSLPGLRVETEWLGTVGDRIALARLTWTGGPDGGAFEIPRIRLFEVDADGRVRALVLFDVEDRAAAFADAQARFAAGEAAALGGQAPIAALVRALGRHDWDALRASLAADAAIRDRRALAVMGEYTRELWIESLRTLADLAPDWDWELFRILAWNRHGRVATGHLLGAVRDGGPFENVIVAVLLTRGEHVERYEYFDAADAERALARFEALCAEREKRSA